MSPWQAHPAHENKYVDWFAVCKLDLLFVNGFIHHLPERAILANGLPASASSPPAVICSSSLCLSDWAPGCHVMGSLLFDGTSDIFKQNSMQLIPRSSHASWVALLLAFAFSHQREGRLMGTFSEELVPLAWLRVKPQRVPLLVEGSVHSSAQEQPGTWLGLLHVETQGVMVHCRAERRSTACDGS